MWKKIRFLPFNYNSNARCPNSFSVVLTFLKSPRRLTQCEASHCLAQNTTYFVSGHPIFTWRAASRTNSLALCIDFTITNSVSLQTTMGLSLGRKLYESYGTGRNPLLIIIWSGNRLKSSLEASTVSSIVLISSSSSSPLTGFPFDLIEEHSAWPVKAERKCRLLSLLTK